MKALLFFALLPLGVFAQTFSANEISRWEAQTKQVTIIRDIYGVPHIYGKTDADAVFGLMYTQCEENFERLERNYLEMLGRRAEMEGEKVLYNDLLMRLIADSNDAKKDFLKSPSWLKKLLIAHADGINYYLFKHPEVHPVVLKRFEPWFHLMYTDGSVSATSTGGASVEEIKQFYQNPIANTTASNNASSISINKDIEDRGSNGFAIAPSKSASKNAMLYINPHVPFYFRNEAQMVSEEGLNAYGASTWGQLFIYQGFNEHCGWMHTSGYTDVADLYEEKVTPTKNGWSYEYENKQRSVKTKTITIQYKKDGQLLSKTFTGFYTHHGPVVAKRNGKWLSLKEYNRSLRALVQSWTTTKANNLAEYTKAMEGLSNTTNNTVYADDKGNIAYWHGNFVPKRDTSFNWQLPVDGTIAATEWKGIHALSQTVHVINPATGWIQNCNATPFTSSGESSPDKNAYPKYMAPDGQNARGLNAIRLLKDKQNISLDGLIEIGYNRYLTAFDILLPSLFKAYDLLEEADSNKVKLKKPIEILKAWNKVSDTTSIATTLGVDWAAKMNTLLPPAATREEGTEIIGRLTKAAATDGKQQLQLLSGVIDNLNKIYGFWEVPWGTINRYQRLTGKFDEEYNDTKRSLAVALTTSKLGSLPAFESRSFNGTKGRYGFSGNSFIAAVEFGPRLKAKSIVTGGQSNNPASNHFTDQAPGFINGNFKEIFFYKEDVLKNKEKIYRPGE
ncbi:MAG: penicillin acylase family protein [Sphingobacteriia bacterium]|jgi:acyl-homoserine lactone acylase PvdQ